MTHSETDNHEINSGTNWWGVAIILLVAFGILSLIIPNFYIYMRARTATTYPQCQSNCKDMGRALKEYHDDNNGEYPRTLTSLNPDYLRVIPTCAASETNRGYMESYQVSDDRKAFTLCCMGWNHIWVGVDRNYPQYNSREGLIPHQGSPRIQKNDEK